MSRRPGWLYPKSPVKFGAGARAFAFVKLVLYVVALVTLLGLASVLLRSVLESNSSDSASSATPPSTVVDGVTVLLMTPVDCGDDPPSADDETPACNPDGILVGSDTYVVNPDVEVITANVTDELFAACAPGDLPSGCTVGVAYIVENVDPAVLVAGDTGAGFVAITGPSIESTTADPTIEVLYTVCVSLLDANSYAQCRVLADPQADEPGD